MARTVANRGGSRDPAWLGEAYEERLRANPMERRRRGAFMTPPQLAQLAVRESVDRWSGRGVPAVLDPACGTGNLLVVAAERLLARGASPGAIAARLKGIEIEAEAARIARTRLEVVLGGGPAVRRALQRGIRCADAVRVPAAWMQCDVVIANPPFLGQLRRGTVVDRAAAARWRARLGDAVRGYADPAAAFLLLSVRSLRPGGRAAVILPRPMLAAASAQAIRDEVDRVARLERIWMDDRFSFDAGTRVCILSLSVPGVGMRVATRALTIHGEVKATLPWKFWGGRWGAAAAASAGVPALEVRQVGRIGDLAGVTADFRDQYYGLSGALCDDRHAGRGLNALRPRTATIDRGASRMDRLPVITTGLIGWNRSLWGERSARLLGRVFAHPAARVPALLPRGEMRGWLSAALHPKILVATQTTVIEAVVDPRGELAPGVPVIRLLPHDAHDVWPLAAALLAPATSAIAWWRHAGAGLSPKAIKLSARQVAELPLPVDRRAWMDAAQRLREAQEARGESERVASLERFAESANMAYRVPKSRRNALLRWWKPRAWGTFTQ
jgi:SAM-dependent methyltransferase